MSSTPVPAGAEGEIVVTLLVNRAMPLIRYRTGDRGSMLVQSLRVRARDADPRDRERARGRHPSSFRMARWCSPYLLTMALEGVAGTRPVSDRAGGAGSRARARRYKELLVDASGSRSAIIAALRTVLPSRRAHRRSRQSIDRAVEGRARQDARGHPLPLRETRSSTPRRRRSGMSSIFERCAAPMRFAAMERARRSERRRTFAIASFVARRSTHTATSLLSRALRRHGVHPDSVRGAARHAAATLRHQDALSRDAGDERVAAGLDPEMLIPAASSGSSGAVHDSAQLDGAQRAVPGAHPRSPFVRVCALRSRDEHSQSEERQRARQQGASVARSTGSE